MRGGSKGFITYSIGMIISQNVLIICSGQFQEGGICPRISIRGIYQASIRGVSYHSPFTLSHTPRPPESRRSTLSNLPSGTTHICRAQYKVHGTYETCLFQFPLLFPNHRYLARNELSYVVRILILPLPCSLSSPTRLASTFST